VAGAGQELARGWSSAERDAAADQFGRAANALIRSDDDLHLKRKTRRALGPARSRWVCSLMGAVR
jgi:hypothetical protein